MVPELEVNAHLHDNKYVNMNARPGASNFSHASIYVTVVIMDRLHRISETEARETGVQGNSTDLTFPIHKLGFTVDLSA